MENGSQPLRSVAAELARSERTFGPNRQVTECGLGIQKPGARLRSMPRVG